MPKELVCTAPRTLGWRPLELKPLAPDQVRVKAEFAASKHGTEMSVYKGTVNTRGAFNAEYQLFDPAQQVAGWGSFPTGVGNMAVGTVTEKGSGVTTLKEGDRVLVYGSFKDVHTVGAANCRKMPAGLSWKSAVCLDPADFALGAVRDGQVRMGDAVAIFSLGAIGLVAVQLAKQSGAYPVIALDMLPNRLEAAKACGADEVLDPSACDAGWELKKLTGKRGVDVAIEYSGSAKALQAALRGVAYGGRVVCGAFPPPFGPGLDLGAEAHCNVPEIVFTRACSEPNREHPRWDNKRIYEVCWRMICEGNIDGEPIVTPVVPFEELPAEYPKIETEPAANIKLGVQY
ncbi:MAG: zinc-binding alcohol dehydrogenase [Planctomycetota bacterium]|nr:zinc-binding alcohol dehydrogenase [Planctomycetota bacterium]